MSTGGFGGGVIRFSSRHPKLITWVMALTTLALVVVAALPTIWPRASEYLNSVAVDTDPENMLPEDAPVRVFHNAMKAEFSIYDMVVVGIVNETDPDGVFNPGTLARIHELSQFALTLQWPDPENPDRTVGVVEADMLSPMTVDDIEQAGAGAVSFNWLMPEPPASREEARAIREAALRLPVLDGTLVSEDGKALALYLPLTSKDLSYRVRKAILAEVEGWPAEDQVYITGLPVAEDTFGIEMFIQMAITAPLAMIVVFLAMWWFFRSPVLIFSPMLLAMASVAATMALLVITGNTIHIMSSMIPIFIMPIAVLDAVHILSEFFDRYPRTGDRRKTVTEVMRNLFTPMLFTSLTTAAGFASLALTPIPPVQVFGVFIAIGVALAWLWSMTFIPAYIMMIPERRLESFARLGAAKAADDTSMGRALGATGRFTFRKSRLVLVGTAAVAVLAGFGITRIEINDNPVKWFTPSHPIRVADRVLNEHFGGTYMAYLALDAGDAGAVLGDYTPGLMERAAARGQALQTEGVPGALEAFGGLSAAVRREAAGAASVEALLDALGAYADAQAEAASDETYEAWSEVRLFVDAERQRGEVFKQPEALRYIEALQARLAAIDVVGKSSSLADVVKTVHRELFLGEDRAFRIPNTPDAVAQTLLTFQNSHRPDDLWHFVTPDYRKTSIWVQLRSGDNQDMTRVLSAVDAFVAANPPPFDLQPRWFGLNYLNVVWQEEMVRGMFQALLGSALVVLLLMTLLFRSALWGLLSMVPLTVSIGLIYGLIGLVGKAYDMPVAVMSSLSLGLAIDYAIHFLARTRAAVSRTGRWRTAVGEVFAEPARAITRNAIVLGVGFLPLIAAPLMPYKSVGFFIAAILVVAGLASLLILPALITVFQKWLFPEKLRIAMVWNLATYLAVVWAFVALVALLIYRFLDMPAVPVSAAGAIAAAILTAAGTPLTLRRTRRAFPHSVPAEMKEETS
ncbi:RND family transporter [Sedimentitalea sp. XS_ASV28]|uniref:efflux RND transporter permease subunit n=1 Tax=Sedimentitalea sp. XS_ASV28 TaxID=3241296 RepID=UPI0035183282